MKLNTIRDNKGARKSLMRVGRGYGSGKGRTAGRGGKGQTARTGVAVNGFEGGQMPIFRRLPKRGFNNIFKKVFTIVNVGTIQKAIDAKLIKAGQEVDEVVLMETGLIKRVKDGVRLLADGKITDKIILKVAGASEAAVKAVEKAGGQVVVVAKPATILEKGKKTSKKEAKKPVRKTKK